MRTVLLDVDTGIDDALAILYAVAHRDLRVAAITCVAGNAPLHRVVANTLATLDAAGAADIPVAAGAARPLLEIARRSGAAHGSDGLGGIDLPRSASELVPEPAIELMRTTILEAQEPVSLVALAPQTNLALLLAAYPEVADNVAEIVFMGGSGANPEGQPPEFNIWQDPEAAAMVLAAGLPTGMYGMDMFTQLTVPAKAVHGLATGPTPSQRLAGELLRRRSPDLPAALLGDAGALIMLTDPELYDTVSKPVQVERCGPDRGALRTGGSDRVVTPTNVISIAAGFDAPAARAQYLRVLSAS